MMVRAIALLLLFAAVAVAQPPEGSHVDFPAQEWMANIGSKLDGAGMCVFTSIEMAAIWCGLEEMRGFRNWCAAQYKGGGYPEKVDELIKAWCLHKGIKAPGYVQYEGPSFELAERALQSGRMACVTLYRSPRYGPRTIYHMVNMVHFDASWGGLMDNNRIGQDPLPPLEGGPRGDIEKRTTLNGRVWVFVWTRHGPPPAPKGDR